MRGRPRPLPGWVLRPSRWALRTGAAALLSGLLFPSPARAQGIEPWGVLSGAMSEEEFLRMRRETPGSFTFERALGRRLDRAIDERVRAGFRLPGVPPALLLQEGVPARVVLGPRIGVVQGRFRFPVVMGLFSDSPETPPVPVETVQREYFDGPNSKGGTIPEFYRELSGGRVELEGSGFDWVRTPFTLAEVGGGVAGLTSSAKVGPYMVDVLRRLDGEGVDWGAFDNDGPDGIPNSGDDDGFVDVLVFLHPTWGAECQGEGRSSNRIWSHRWSLRARTGSPFTTRTPSLAPGVPFVRVNDYTIQGVLSCDRSSMNEIGVMAHELGHGFGLPDLYGTGGVFRPGGGNWELMATGTYGCTGEDPSRPCHMGAWSKAVLGWVDVETPAPDTDHGTVTLAPVVRSGRVLQIEAGDGSGEFFLLENRQRIGFDQGLLAPGLLIWHIQPGWIGDRRTGGSRWAGNAVNAVAGEPGVWLREADGGAHLTGNRNRGDPGDIFPGAANARAFHFGTLPASRTHAGAASGLTLTGLEEVGEDLRFRLRTTFRDITLLAAAPAGSAPLPGSAPFLVDGVARGSGSVARVAPFQSLRIEAAGGLPEGEGIRRGFAGWMDGVTDRARTLTEDGPDGTLTARFDPVQVLVSGSVRGGVDTISPGSIRIEPASEDGWVERGVVAKVTAVPRTGFGFAEWSGVLSGTLNPATLVAGGPAELEARFSLRFAPELPPSLVLEAARDTTVALGVREANEPVSWSLETGGLPEGLALDPAGRLSGAPLRAGTFDAVLSVRDAIGLSATAPVSLRVTAPSIAFEVLAAPFVLTGSPPTDPQLRYLDVSGNGNGVYDLGDLRAFLFGGTP